MIGTKTSPQLARIAGKLNNDKNRVEIGSVAWRPSLPTTTWKIGRVREESWMWIRKLLREIVEEKESRPKRLKRIAWEGTGCVTVHNLRAWPKYAMKMFANRLALW